jgi:hypothetical protein
MSEHRQLRHPRRFRADPGSRIIYAIALVAMPPCLVGIEACGTSHHWARELIRLGHQVRLMPPAYVKPYVKRGKTDAERHRHRRHQDIVGAGDIGRPDAAGPRGVGISDPDQFDGVVIEGEIIVCRGCARPSDGHSECTVHCVNEEGIEWLERRERRSSYDHQL